MSKNILVFRVSVSSNTNNLIQKALMSILRSTGIIILLAASMLLFRDGVLVFSDAGTYIASYGPAILLVAGGQVMLAVGLTMSAVRLMPKKQTEPGA